MKILVTGARGYVGKNLCAQLKNIRDGKVPQWEVSEDKIEAVHMLPGYTHNIINLSDNEDLVTVMYCNEVFNPDNLDTSFKLVK